LMIDVVGERNFSDARLDRGDTRSRHGRCTVDGKFGVNVIIEQSANPPGVAARTPGNYTSGPQSGCSWTYGQ
jgi:hypothetical protein